MGCRFQKFVLLFGRRLVVVLLAAFTLPASLRETAQPDTERVVPAVTVVAEHHLILQGQGQTEGHSCRRTSSYLTRSNFKVSVTEHHPILQGSWSQNIIISCID